MDMKNGSTETLGCVAREGYFAFHSQHKGRNSIFFFSVGVLNTDN